MLAETDIGLFPSEAEVQRLLVGPDSVAWQYGSDTRLFTAALYALLMQVAHPTVGAGVRDYSDFDRRPWNRLFRTVDYVNLLIYGGADAAAAGRRLRAMHKQFRGVREDGRRYYALEPEAYAWVHATLIDAYVSGHRHFARPMRPDQIERFYAEYRGLGRLIGMRGGALPDTWPEFRCYFERMSAEVLVHTESVDRVLHAVAAAGIPDLRALPRSLTRGLRRPPSHAAYVAGVGLLSPELRERLGVRWRRRDEREFGMLSATMRAMTPVMPQWALVFGPTLLRLRRRAIARGPLGPGADRPAALLGSTGAGAALRDG